MLARAFTLIDTETGSELEVLEALREVPEVKETYAVYGLYDIVTKIEADSIQDLKDIITSRIRSLDKISSLLTLICVDH